MKNSVIQYFKSYEFNEYVFVLQLLFIVICAIYYFKTNKEKGIRKSLIFFSLFFLLGLISEVYCRNLNLVSKESYYLHYQLRSLKLSYQFNSIAYSCVAISKSVVYLYSKLSLFISKKVVRFKLDKKYNIDSKLELDKVIENKVYSKIVKEAN